MGQVTRLRAAGGAAAPRDTVVETLGPHRVADPYRWLEDPADPRTVAWLVEQRDRFRAARASWPSRDGFRRRLAELTAFELCTPPVWRGRTAFFTSQGPGREHAALRTLDPSGAERVLLDPAHLDPSGGTTLDAWSPGPDGRLVACQLSAGGTEDAVLRVLDAGSGTFVGEPLAGCRYSAVAWLPDGTAFCCVREDEPGAGPRVWRHTVGADPAAGRLVFVPPDEDADLDLALDETGRHLLITVDGPDGTAIWLLDLPGRGAPGGNPVRVAACPDGWSAVWPGRDGRLYLLTDDGAPRGRIVVADTASATADPGRTLVPEAPSATLESCTVLDGAGILLAAWSQSGRSTLTVHDLATGTRRWDVPLPGPGIVAAVTSRPEGHEAWFSYTDTLTPPTVYRLDAADRSVRRWRPPAPAASGPAFVPPRGVRAAELRYPSADGTQVRMLLTLPLRADGPRPAIVHAYGAFGESQLADYYEFGLAWAEAGGVLAIPCVRGGGEEGEAWHEAGMRDRKQRGIDDLLAAVTYLVRTGLADPRAIGVKGFSAGGLLAAAALVQAPDRFAAAELTSPLLDMARYELSGLGHLWSEEFGHRDDPDELAALLAYSPYHNVAAGTGYPAVLLAVFDGDTRVDPMHARKMCAALQHATCSGRPVLLRTEPGVGHGERSRSARLNYFADVLSFFTTCLGGDPAIRTGPVAETRRGGEPA